MDIVKKIVPTEEITVMSSISQRARQLEREDYWCRELCTVYIPMALMIMLGRLIMYLSVEVIYSD